MVRMRKINYDRLPEHMRSGARLWIEHGIPPGSFLMAVIENNLKEAVFRADGINLPRLPDFVSFFYNEAPSDCWGSKAKAEAWAQMKRRQDADGDTDVSHAIHTWMKRRQERMTD